MTLGLVVAEEDIRGMLRLVGQVHRTSGEPLARWRCLLDGLCRLVRADVGITSRMGNGISNPQRWTTSIVEYGSPTDDERKHILDYFEMHEFAGTNHATEVDQSPWDGAWYCEESDKDQFLFGLCRPPQSEIYYGLGLHRRPNHPPFPEEHRKLIDLFMSELSWLYQSILSLPSESSGTGLSPRLSQTLERLMAGDSEKQVAYNLGLSRHTVHGYIKTIYRHFDVSSRGELLARCLATDASQNNDDP